LKTINDLKQYFNDIVRIIDNKNRFKVLSYLKQIPILCFLNKKSELNRVLRDANSKKFHPIKTHKGDIYNANITENVGSELSENHLVIIVQGKSSNIFGEKVTIVPIEGDGNKINPRYQIKLTNDDLEYGQLDKNPSRIIFTDVTTLDKARLSRKIGKLSSTKMKEVNNYLIKHLELNIEAKTMVDK